MDSPAFIDGRQGSGSPPILYRNVPAGTLDTRTLDEEIDGQLFERTAISRKPGKVIKRELETVKTTDQILLPESDA